MMDVNAGVVTDQVKQVFRFEARNAGLTYPQCQLDEWDFATAFFCHGYLGECSKVVIGKEHHKDGGTHYHCYVHWSFKVKARGANIFDLEGYHPNVKTFSGKGVQLQINRWISYCKKEGLWYQDGFLDNLFTFIHWQNYRAQKQDLLAWEHDAKAQQLKPAFPFRLPLEYWKGRIGRTIITGKFVLRSAGPPGAPPAGSE